MDFNERVSILKQGVELGQKGGAYTIDDAYYAKQALDALVQGVSVKNAFEILIKLVVKAQKNGVYTLKDAYVLFSAINEYETSLPQPAPQPQPQSQPTPEPAPQPTKKTTKKESN